MQIDALNCIRNKKISAAAAFFCCCWNVACQIKYLFIKRLEFIEFEQSTKFPSIQMHMWFSCYTRQQQPNEHLSKDKCLKTKQKNDDDDTRDTFMLSFHRSIAIYVLLIMWLAGCFFSLSILSLMLASPFPSRFLCLPPFFSRVCVCFSLCVLFQSLWIERKYLWNKADGNIPSLSLAPYIFFFFHFGSFKSAQVVAMPLNILLPR